MTRLLTEDEVAEIREDRAFDSDACDAPRDGDPRCDRTGPPVDCCDACVLVLLLDSHTAQASRIAESERRRGEAVKALRDVKENIEAKASLGDVPGAAMRHLILRDMDELCRRILADEKGVE